ncbi:YchF family ATPase [Myxococcota bacterium]|nr:YchF family ATPase [Myxococcota bacterium]
MKVALVGFQGAGKTSVFNALTGQTAETGLGKKGGSNLGRIQVPDARIDALSKIYSPKKTTYAEIQFVDVAGPTDSGERSETGLDQALVAQIRESEALVHVVRAFDNAALTRTPDPARDIGSFEEELILTDLVQIENRITRLKKEKKTTELDLMEKLKEALEQGTALRRLSLAPEEWASLSGFRFLSQKPMLVVVNQAESAVGKPLDAKITEAAESRGVQLLAMCASVEAEIMQMPPEDQVAFLADLGLTEPVRTRFIQAAYALLDLISFLTSGEDEVRAWTIKRGTIAKVAGGKIHSDIERGFIRAEVTPFAEFVKFGSEAKVKEAGKLRLEGKEYVVQDGDIVHFRHSS